MSCSSASFIFQSLTKLPFLLFWECLYTWFWESLAISSGVEVWGWLVIFIPLGPPYGSLLTYIVKSSNIYTFHGQIFIRSDIFFLYFLCGLFSCRSAWWRRRLPSSSIHTRDIYLIIDFRYNEIFCHCQIQILLVTSILGEGFVGLQKISFLFPC